MYDAELHLQAACPVFLICRWRKASALCLVSKSAVPTGRNTSLLTYCQPDCYVGIADLNNGHKAGALRQRGEPAKVI